MSHYILLFFRNAMENKALSLPLINSTATTRAPNVTVEQNVQTPVITRPNSIRPPALNVQPAMVGLQQIATTSAAYSPSLTITIKTTVITSGQVLPPYLTIGAIPVGAAVIPSSVTLGVPIVRAAPVILSGSVVPSSTLLRSPTISAGAISIQTAVIVVASAVRAPGLTVQSYSIGPPFISVGSSAVAPSVTTSAVNLKITAIKSGAVLPPLLATQPISISASTISSSAVNHPPSVIPGAKTIGPSLKNLLPLLSGMGPDSGPIIKATSKVTAPSLSVGLISLTTSVVVSGGVFTPRVLVQSISVVVPAISQTTLYAPSLRPSAQAVKLPLIVSGTIFSPVVAPQPLVTAPPCITSTAVIYAVALRQVVRPPVIESTSVCRTATMVVQPITNGFASIDSYVAAVAIQITSSSVAVDSKRSEIDLQFGSAQSSITGVEAPKINLSFMSEVSP